MADAEKFERVLIKRLKPYKNNAKEHSKRQIDAIKKSIKKFGFINPILIDRDYNVIAGHGRITATKDDMNVGGPGPIVILKDDGRALNFTGYIYDHLTEEEIDSFEFGSEAEKKYLKDE